MDNKRLNVPMPDEVLVKLTKESKETGLLKQRMVEDALRTYLKMEKK